MDSELLAIAILLAELLLAAVVAAVVFGRLWWRARRRLAALQGEARDSERERADYLNHVQSAISALIAAVRSRWNENPATLHQGSALADGDPPRVGLQLHYETLRHELSALQAPPEQFWEARRGALDTLLEGFRTAEATLQRWLETSRNQHREDLAQARRSHGESAQQLERQLERQQGRSARLEQRVQELEAYRRRFNELHGAMLRLRDAGERLEPLVARELAGGQGSAELQAAVGAWQQAQAPLQQFLERGDIQPFGERHLTAAPSPDHRARRANQLAEGRERQAEVTERRLLLSLKHQYALIDDLRAKLDAAEHREEELRHYYTQQIKRLEAAAAETEQSFEALMKENARNRRTIRRLNKRLDEANRAEASGDTKALEATIDRFAAQAIELQERLTTLEGEVGELSAENLSLQAKLREHGLDEAATP
ncbi:hypothetical protein [Sediminicurvatus halobius]|uniref:Uncharacterized protein n=1 Tax=Sediminicurvatus halobius TaxID=2182432 RepID=A0A2U2MZX6_9GAMM|nr:hypothetical protein [Spiribacter halobius]PWG62476.1 hypothetical protein DEM34_11870 [Spiribacter halobius]UEX78566.1 hypothetical protein LMH63_02670 [Spiribacter halobius]